MKRLAVVGSALSGGAAQIIDAVGTHKEFVVVAIFDSDESAMGRQIFGVPVLSSSDAVREYYDLDFFDEVIIAIGGDLVERERIFIDLISLNIPLANVIDSSAQLRSNAVIGVGNVILGNVFIGPGVTIADNCYVISGTTINHDCKVGSHTYFSSGCTLAGNVVVGERVRFDTASGAKANTVIGDDEYIYPGKIVTSKTRRT